MSVKPKTLARRNDWEFRNREVFYFFQRPEISLSTKTGRLSSEANKRDMITVDGCFVPMGPRISSSPRDTSVGSGGVCEE